MAIWLVGEWIRECGTDITEAIKEIEEQEDSIKNQLLEAWARRLEYMQGNNDAEKLYARLVDIHGGPFAKEDVVCSDFGSRLILAMSTVNPVATSECLYFIFHKHAISYWKEALAGKARRNIVTALEKLCFCRDSFRKAAATLARLALAENEDWANNSRGQFKQLFHVFLAGTEADLNERIELIKYLHKREHEYQELLLEALKGSFSIQNLSRMGGAEKFGLRTLDDYSPNGSEIRKYWHELYEILKDWITLDPKCISDVADIVQCNTRNLIRFGEAGLLFDFVGLLAPPLNYEWNKMYNSLIEVRNSDNPSPELTKQIAEWEKKLEPKDFVSRMKAALHDAYTKQETGKEILIEEEKAIIPFANEFVGKKLYMTEDLKGLILNDEEYISWSFISHVTQSIPTEEVKQMERHIKDIVFTQEKNFYSPFIVSLYRRIPHNTSTTSFIAELFNAQYYTLALPLMAVTDDERRTNLVFLYKQVREHTITLGDTLNYLKAIQVSTSEELSNILEIIKQFTDDIAYQFNFLSQYWYRSDFYNNEELQVSYKNILLNYPIDNQPHYDYEYVRQVKSVLEKTHDSVFAKAINYKLIDIMSSKITQCGLEDIFVVLLSNYDTDIWYTFIEALMDIENKGKFYLQVKLKVGSGFSFEEGPLFRNHYDELKEACVKYSNNAPWICASMCPTFDVADEETGEIDSFHPFAIWLLENYGNDRRVLDEFHANLGTFHWIGSTIPLYENIERCFHNLLKNRNLPKEAKLWTKKCLESNKNDYDCESINESYMRMAYKE